MSDRTSENVSPILDETASGRRSTASGGERTINDYAYDCIEKILDRNPNVTVMIADTNGKILTSTLSKRETEDKMSNVLSFTDKCKVLVRKILNEELEFVRIKGQGKEVIVTFEEQLEIVTIQDDSNEMR